MLVFCGVMIVPLTFDELPICTSDQVRRLISLGLPAEDETVLFERLSCVSYYRLKEYLISFKQEDNRFSPGTTFDLVWRRYTFDRHLRLVTLDAIERVEVGVLRTRMIEWFMMTYGAKGHLERKNFRDEFRHDNFLDDLEREARKSKENEVRKFFATYTEEKHLPLWIAAEKIMSFGLLVTFYRGLNYYEQQDIARSLGIQPPVLNSWLIVLNYIRNVCAHHGRLWNLELSIKPFIPRNDLRWYKPVNVENERVFSALTVLKYLLSYIAPQSQWQHRLEALLSLYPDIPIKSMGFPDNWEECPIWGL